MKCPKCRDVDLVEHKLRNRETRVDQCPRCKGVWFDEDELAETIETVKRNVEVPANAWRGDAPCPRCGEPLHTFPYPGTMVLVEMCRACSGIWLERREIARMKAAKAQAKRALESPAAAAAVPAAPSMRCPKCGAVGPKADACSKCGVIVAKHRAAEARSADRARRLAREYPEGRGLKGSLLRFVNGTIERLTTF